MDQEELDRAANIAVAQRAAQLLAVSLGAAFPPDEHTKVAAVTLVRRLLDARVLGTGDLKSLLDQREGR